MGRKLWKRRKSFYSVLLLLFVNYLFDYGLVIYLMSFCRVDIAFGFEASWWNY